jgi:hypothetical protein
MSAKVLSDSKHIQDIEDDRESAFYVLTWAALLFNRHDSLNRLRVLLDAYEEAYTVDGRDEGGWRKRFMFLEPPRVEFDSRPLNALIRELREVLAVRYMPAPSGYDIAVHNHLLEINSQLAQEHPVAKFNERRQQITRPSWLVGTFRRHLEFDYWPQDDKAEQNPITG